MEIELGFKAKCECGRPYRNERIDIELADPSGNPWLSKGFSVVHIPEDSNHYAHGAFMICASSLRRIAIELYPADSIVLLRIV